MSLEQLESELARRREGRDPDRWAAAAYRVAVARSESATGREQLTEALDLLDRAGRILTETRSPLEHARILTVAANCHRRLGRPDRAAPLFERAAHLIEARATPNETAAALVNSGLALTEAGHAPRAVERLDRALVVLAGDSDGEASRVRTAALINRAQARQSIGGDREIEAAIADYAEAVACSEEDTPQRAMALHGLGAAILETISRDRPAGSSWSAEDAIAAFHRALRILTPKAFPFQHAIARHSLAVAYERRSRPGDTARAVNSVEAAMTMLDPRLHSAQWQSAAATLSRLENASETGGGARWRIGRVVSLMSTTTAAETTALLRERLVRLAGWPELRRRRELDLLSTALTELGVANYQKVMRSMIPVLMELPDPVLDSACRSLCEAHRGTATPSDFDRALDEVIHDLLFGPQRVRVRDLLEANGWIRP